MTAHELQLMAASAAATVITLVAWKAGVYLITEARTFYQDVQAWKAGVVTPQQVAQTSYQVLESTAPRAGGDHRCGLGARSTSFGVAGKGATHCAKSYTKGDRGYNRCEGCRAREWGQGFIGRSNLITPALLDRHDSIVASRKSSKNETKPRKKADRKPNGRKCLGCDSPLVGRQTLWCDDARRCKNEYLNKKERKAAKQAKKERKRDRKAAKLDQGVGSCTMCAANDVPTVDLVGERLCADCVSVMNEGGPGAVIVAEKVDD